MVLNNDLTIWCPICRGRGSTELQPQCVGCGGSGVIAQVMHSGEETCS